MYRVSTEDGGSISSRVRRDLARGPVLVSGEFFRLKTLYEELADELPQADREHLARLMVPLADGKPDLSGLPDRRGARRIGEARSGSFPLEHLLLVGDFPRPKKLLAALFPDTERLPSGARASLKDPKGLLAIGQIRAILSVLCRLPAGSPQARRHYTIERWPDHVTFRPAVLAPEGVGRAVIDVAQIESAPNFEAALADHLDEAFASSPRIAVDRQFVRYDRTCAWAFNRAFWRFLGIWERVTQKTYQRALPKGKAESNHPEFIDEAAANFAMHVRELEREGAILPGSELWIHEKAPGSGEFVAGLLDRLRAGHADFYRRARIVLSDISKQVLDIAAAELKRHGHWPPAADGPRIYFRNTSATGEASVRSADGRTIALDGRFIYARHANFFDQLPSRLFAKLDGRFYEVYVRAVIPLKRLSKLEADCGLTLADLRDMAEGRIDLETQSENDQARWVGFWSAVWSGIKFEERLKPVADLAAEHPQGEALAALFAAQDEVRFLTSDGAVAELLADLDLLHPGHGYACFSDIFLQRSEEFNERWIELAKYDNGVWVGTNGILLARLLEERGCDFGFHPVELTLGIPTPVYTLSVKKRDPAIFVFPPALVQRLTGIDSSAVPEARLSGLPRRVRNNLRDLAANLARVRSARDWAERTFDRSFDLTGLLRELYYRSPPHGTGANSLFVKMAALVAEFLASHPDREIRFEIDLKPEDLRELEDFLQNRPIDALGDLIEPGRVAQGAMTLGLRLPTLARKLARGEFLLLAEMALPASQPVEQMRRRILQTQQHVDAVSITSGRLADPRFLRSRDLLALPLLESIDRDKLVITLEMRDRRAIDLETDIAAFEKRGARNFFFVTGDFERASEWWLDSLHGIQIADRMRHGEGADGRDLGARSRSLIIGALTWGGIPGFEHRIERDAALKAEAGADMLFTQPVYDLAVARQVLALMARARLDREVYLVVEILPLVSLELLRNLSRAPGISVPPEMRSCFEQIDRNAAAFFTGRRASANAGATERAEFVERLFAGVPEIPGYAGLFSPAFAERLYERAAQSRAQAERKAPRGREAEAAGRGARDRIISELGLALAERAMEALIAHSAVSGFLFVARTGQELGRLVAKARQLRPEKIRAEPAARRFRDGKRDRTRRYAEGIARIAECLAPFGLELDEGTPMDARLPAVIRGDSGAGPAALVRLTVDDRSENAGASAPLDVLVEALKAIGRPDRVDLRVRCVPAGWESGSRLIRDYGAPADFLLRLDIDEADAPEPEAGRRPLRVRFSGEPAKARFARWLERHPYLYSLAALGEFSFKHPLFGQVLCGGPCGLSGAWQFSCTMAKTFVSRRRIEENLLLRPIFRRRREELRDRPLRREAWACWEKILRLALWPPMAARRCLVYLATGLPTTWFTKTRGLLQALTTSFLNHLECPKSLRNGACGAPTADGRCGELLQYGVSKPCVFVVRNVKDERGLQFAQRLIRRAEAWRGSAWGRVSDAAASTLQLAAAIVNRRPLSQRIYPRVDETVPGASAIVNAMAGRFSGATLFGDRKALPAWVARSEIRLIARDESGRATIRRLRRLVRPLPRKVSAAGKIVAAILRGIAQETGDEGSPAPSVGARESAYERMLSGQSAHEPRPRAIRNRFARDR